LTFRGKEKFRTNPNYGDKVEYGEILSSINSDRPPFNNPTTTFGESEEIKNYIAEIR